MIDKKELYESIRACVHAITYADIWDPIEVTVADTTCNPSTVLISDNVWMPVEANWNDYVFPLIYKRTDEYNKK